MHGVGAAVVNALSKWLEVEVYQNGKIYRQRFEYAYDSSAKKVMPGTAVTKLEVVGKTDETGTRITFMPDKDVFTVTEFKEEEMRLQELSFQTRYNLFYRYRQEESIVKTSF